jgi:hypothetical protein
MPDEDEDLQNLVNDTLIHIVKTGQNADKLKAIDLLIKTEPALASGKKSNQKFIFVAGDIHSLNSPDQPLHDGGSEEELMGVIASKQATQIVGDEHIYTQS